MRSLLALLLLSGCTGSATHGDLEMPILARTNSAGFSCRVQTDHREYKPLYWSYAGHDSISTDAASWVARIESAQVIDYQPTPGELVVSTIDDSGKLGESHAIDSSTLSPVSDVAKVAAPKVGGLLHKRSSLRAGTLLTTFQTTFHTSSDPGFAAFRCTANEG